MEKKKKGGRKVGEHMKERERKRETRPLNEIKLTSFREN